MKIVAFTKANVNPIINRIPGDLAGRIEIVQCQSLEELTPHAADAGALLTTNRLDEQAVSALPGLHWIQSLSAGVDGLPLEYIRNNGIRLTNARGIHQIQMSEYALLAMLQWARRADLHYRNQLNRVWGKSLPVGELYGQTVGILGSGSIGQAIARKAKAFGMRILGYNRSGSPVPDFDEMLSGGTGLHRLLAESDYVILLLPATAETRHFLAMEQFKQMKSSACLINLSRGSVLHEAQLVEALRSGVIAGAVLDVFEEEPLPPESPLWELPNAILTPHTSGLSPHYMHRAAEIVFENIRRVLDGSALINEVDPERGY